MLGGWFANKPNGVDVVAGEPLYLPELPNPKTKQDYDDLAAKSLQELIKLEQEDEDDGWLQTDVPEEGVELWEKPHPSGFSCVKTSSVMPGSPKRFFDWICQQDLTPRQRWEPDLTQYKILEDVTDSIHVLYRNYTAPYGVAPREFVAFNARTKMPDGTYISWGRSINHPMGISNPKFVRGTVIVSGMVVKPIKGQPNRCLVIRLAQLDLKGMIPGWIISMGKKRAATNHARLRTIAESDLSSIPLDSESEIDRPSLIVEEKSRNNHGKQEKESHATISNGPPIEASFAPVPQPVEFVPAPVSIAPQVVVPGPAPAIVPGEASSNANLLLQTTYNQQVSQLVAVLQVQHQQREAQIQNSLRNIETMLTNLQADAKSNSEQIKTTASVITSQKSSSDQLFQLIQGQITRLTQRKTGILSLRFDTLFLIFAWPFIAHVLYEFVVKKWKK